MDTPLAQPRLRLAGSWCEPDGAPARVPFPTVRALEAYQRAPGPRTPRVPSPSAPSSPQRETTEAASHARLKTPSSRGFVNFSQLAAAQPHAQPHAATTRPAPRADLSAGDARWVLAVLCSRWLEGGTAAVLTPANRDKLLRAARSMGLRFFDASLIIAIVQDDARRGIAGLSSDAQQRLAMIRPAAQKKPQANLRLIACVTLFLAAAMAMALAAWVGG